jgi:hypothetical protein
VFEDIGQALTARVSANGAKAFTAPQAGVAATAANHLVTKAQLDAVGALVDVSQAAKIRSLVLFAAALAGIEAREAAFRGDAGFPLALASQVSDLANVKDVYVPIAAQTIRPTTGRVRINALAWTSNSTGGATTLYARLQISTGYTGFIIYDSSVSGTATSAHLFDIIDGLVSGTEYTVQLMSKQSGTANGLSVYGKIYAEG